ncbi:MAG: HEAT repeat domain-containing protein [Promethearchaeia archaeon]
MSKDIRDLIDLYEKKNRKVAEYESTISFLKEEIERLNFTIEEQKRLIEDLKQNNKEETEFPDDLQILKDLIVSQRQELLEKDREIERLNDKLEEIIKKYQNELNIGKRGENEEIIKLKKMIVQITDENEKLKKEIKQLEKLQLNNRESELLEELNIANQKLKVMIAENDDLRAQVNYLQNEINDIKSKREPSENENFMQAQVQIENLKLENQQLQEQIKFLEQELEATKLKLENEEKPFESIKNMDYFEELLNISEENLEKIYKIKNKLVNLRDGLSVNLEKDTLIEELTSKMEAANETINNLIKEVNEYKSELAEQEKEIIKKNIKISAITEKLDALKDINKEIKNHEVQRYIDTEKSELINNLQDKIKNMEEEISNLKEENELLYTTIEKIEKEKEKLENQINASLNQNELIKLMNPNILSTAKGFILSILKKIDNSKREEIIESLIKTLKSPNFEIKSFAIDILSEFKDKNIYYSLVDLIDDKDWMIRYKIVKALSKYHDYDIKLPLEILSKDEDVDVRELAWKVIKNLEKKMIIND